MTNSVFSSCKTGNFTGGGRFKCSIHLYSFSFSDVFSPVSLTGM